MKKPGAAHLARVEINEKTSVALTYALAGALEALKFTSAGYWKPFHNHNTGQRGLVTLNDAVIGEFTHPADAEHSAAWPPSRLRKLILQHQRIHAEHHMTEDGLTCSCGFLWPCVQIESVIEFWLDGDFAFIAPDEPVPDYHKQTSQSPSTDQILGRMIDSIDGRA